MALSRVPYPDWEQLRHHPTFDLLDQLRRSESAQAIADLARLVNREGLRTWETIPVICGAERLWDHDRADLVQAFGPAVSETYGYREFMLMGAECEVHERPTNRSKT